MIDIIFIGILAIVAMGMGIGYGIRSHEVGKKAAARDFLNGILIFVLLIIIWVFLRLLQVPLRVNGLMIICLTGTAVYWVYFIIFLQRKKQAGLVLLDLGRSTQHKMILISGGLFLLVGIFDLVELFVPGSEIGIKDISSILVFLSLGVLMIFWGRSHFEIREGGLLCLDSFVKWQQIKSYRWEGKNNLTLTLRLRQRSPFSRTRSLHIPALHKETVENLLERYLQSDKNNP